MYKIIGSDGREYGPYSMDQLRQWIAQGRADWQTLTQAVGTTGWQPLGSLPEFAPPVPPISAVAPPPLRPASPPATNGMAVAGFVVGLLGLFCFGPPASILGIVFSSVALSQIKRNPAKQNSRGLAQAGLVLSIIGLVIGLLVGVLLWRWGMRGHPPIFWHRHWQV